MESTDEEKLLLESLYRKQIQFLEEELESCQLKCEQLTKQNQELVLKCAALERDRKDVLEYLAHSAAAADREEAELLARLERHRLQAEEQQAALQRQHNLKMEKLQGEVEEARREVSKQALTLLKLEQEVLLIEENVSQRASVEEQLEIQALEHQADLELLVQELQQETNRILQKLRNDAAEEELAVEREREAAEKKMLEEARSQAEVNFQQVQLKKLLLRRDAERQSDIVRMTAELQLTTHEVHSIKQVMKLWMRRYRYLQAEAQRDQNHLQRTFLREEAVRQQFAMTCEDLHQFAVQLCVLGAELRSSRRRALRHDESVRQVAAVLRPVVMGNMWSKDPQRARRDLQGLLQVLEGPPPLGALPMQEHLPQETSSPDRPGGPDFCADALFLMARYRPGDLGILAQRTWDHQDSQSRSRTVM